MTKQINFERNLVEQKLKKAKLLEKKNSRQCHTIGLTPFFDFSKNILKRILYGSLKLAGFEGMNLSQTAEKKKLYFLTELIEIYLPVPIVCFSNERNEAPQPKYCSCKIPLYQGFFEFSKISIFGGLTPSFMQFFMEISKNETRKS